MPDKIDQGKIDPSKIHHSEDEPLNLDAVRDELGRVPVIGPDSDRDLFFDLPSGGLPAAGLAAGSLANPHIAECQPPVEREFLANDFSHGF
jgi:hypothetical protein